MFLYDDKTWSPHLRTSTASSLFFETEKPVGSSASSRGRRWAAMVSYSCSSRGRGWAAMVSSSCSRRRLRFVGKPEQLVCCQQSHLLPASHYQCLPGSTATARWRQLRTASRRPPAGCAPGARCVCAATHHSRLGRHLHRCRRRRQPVRRSLRTVRELLSLLSAGDEHSGHPNGRCDGGSRLCAAQPEERWQPGGADLHRVPDGAGVWPAAVGAVLCASQPATAQATHQGKGARRGGDHTAADARSSPSAATAPCSQAAHASPPGDSPYKRPKWTPVVAA